MNPEEDVRTWIRDAAATDNPSPDLVDHVFRSLTFDKAVRARRMPGVRVAAVTALAVLIGVSVVVVVNSGRSAGPGGATRSAGGQPGSVPPTVVQLQSVLSETLPATPVSLATSADGTAWCWVNTGGASVLYHWDPSTGAFGPVDLGNTAALGLETAMQNAMVVDSSGTVWVGANKSLVSYDPATGAISRITLPPAAVDNALGADRPSPLASLQAISAMAASPSGAIAIASTNSNVVQILDTSTGTFTQLPLGSGIEANDVAYLSDGTLGVFELNYNQKVRSSGNLLIVSPDGTTTTVSGISTETISPAAGGFLANDSGQYISESGQVSSEPGGTIAKTTSGSDDDADAGGTTVSLGSSGKVAWISRAGLVVGSDSGVAVLQLPEHRCGSVPSIVPSGPYVPSGPARSTTTTTYTPDRRCSVGIGRIAASTSGNGIYLVPDGDTSAVDFVPSTTW